MAGETQSSSLSGTIHTELIDTLMTAYAYDDLTITRTFRQASLVGATTTTQQFVRAVKSTGPVAGTPASEVTALAPTEMTTTSTTCAVARVGIAREITDTVVEDSVFGRALYTEGFIADAAKLWAEYFDTASAALFTSISNEVGDSGDALTVETMVSAVGRQRAAKARGPQFIALHDNQLKQLQQSQAAATATPWAIFYSPSGDGAQYGGTFMNNPVWASGLVPASTGDRVGCIYSNGNDAGARPEYCSFGFVYKRMPTSKTETHILMDSIIWASYARTGVVEIIDGFATAIRSVNA